MREIENTNYILNNILDAFGNLQEMDPDIPIFLHIQASVPMYKHRIAYLIDSIGVRYFYFDSSWPYYELRPKPSPKNVKNEQRKDRPT